ncbi:MAG: hypothetical protein ACPG4T_13795 [Nannocystaceae bacterium]
MIDGRGLPETRADALGKAWAGAIESGVVELPVLVCGDDVEKTLQFHCLDANGDFQPAVYAWLHTATATQALVMIAAKNVAGQIQQIYGTLAEDFSVKWAEKQRANV